MKTRLAARTAALVSVFGLLAQASFGQATPETAGIPQPHLAKARADAFQDNNWKFPALITCYPNEGQPAEKVIKDPGPAKVADNFYFLGDGIVAAWALDTRDGIILIDTLNNREEADKFIIGGLQKLGLDPARIRTIIVSHGHGDHYGGATYLKEKYGARIYMTAPDYDFAEKNAGRSTVWGPPPHRDQVANDGQTVILGDTGIKLFITASLEARAQRRLKELQARQLQQGGETAIYARVLQDMQERDARDQGRSISPTKPATDALIIDTSDLMADQVFERALAFIASKMKA